MRLPELRERLLHAAPWLGGALLLTLALVLRFVSLGSRPVIHDESMFSFYSMVFAKDGRYVHMPLMHGPTLMLLTGYVFRAFGDSIEVARAFIATCSLVVLGASLGLTPRPLRWWLAPLLIVSPILLYFSRFMRNEMLFAAVLMVAMLTMSFALSGRKPRALWPALALSTTIGLLAIKENSLFVYAAALTFGAVWAADRWLLRRLWRRPAPRPEPGSEEADGAPLVRRRIGIALSWSSGLVLGLAAVALVFGMALGPDYRRPAIESVVGDDAARVTAVLQRRESLPWHGQARVAAQLMAKSWINLKASWEYWEGQHSEQRIFGALHYHVPILLTYELPLLLLLFGGLIRDAASARQRAYAYAGGLGAWVAVWLLWRAVATPEAPGWLAAIQDFLHIGPNGSMMTLGLMIVPLLVWSILCLREDRVLPAWLGWWAACSLFQYSSAGEKVPWLAVHIVLPFYLVLARIWEPWLAGAGRAKRRWAAAAVALATLISLRNDVPLIGERSADPRERLVYNHTTPWFDDFSRRKLAEWRKDDSVPFNQRRVVLAGATGWPGIWYFRGTRYQLHPASTDMEQIEPGADLMMGELKQSRALMEGPRAEDWVIHQGSMRDHWWAPWPGERPARKKRSGALEEGWFWKLCSNIAGLWRYYWLRETWTPPGGFPVVAFEPKQSAPP